MLHLQLHTVFEDVSAGTAFDVLMDPEYRSHWDDASIRDFDICKLDDSNDLGYYASRYFYADCVSWRNAYSDVVFTWSH